MAFATISTKDASTLALAMNLAVSSISFFLFQRAKCFDWQLAWPFLVGSVPMAFLGGKIPLSDSIHKWILAIVLLYASIALLAKTPRLQGEIQPPQVPLAIAIGAGVGLISGMVGVGGGIFLSPVLILLGWAEAKRTAAVSALFILLNSTAGLAARADKVVPIVSQNGIVLFIAVAGAIGGSWIGANRLPDLGVRRTLGAVLLLAVFKLLVR